MRFPKRRRFFRLVIMHQLKKNLTFLPFQEDKAPFMLQILFKRRPRDKCLSVQKFTKNKKKPKLILKEAQLIKIQVYSRMLLCSQGMALELKHLVSREISPFMGNCNKHRLKQKMQLLFPLKLRLMANFSRCSFRSQIQRAIREIILDMIISFIKRMKSWRIQLNNHSTNKLNRKIM